MIETVIQIIQMALLLGMGFGIIMDKESIRQQINNTDFVVPSYYFFTRKP